jgi:phosphinothricin acetyltransferase
MINFRLAIGADACGMLDIYAPYITNTSITFETELPSANAFSERMENYLQDFPWLVCELNEKIIGYAYASRYRERTAYQWSVESSVYIHRDFMKLGIARTLYSVLMEILKKQGFMNVYAVINLPNEPSVTFHEKFGFRHFADYKNVGFKLGLWKTVGWWQIQLNEYTDEPAPPLKFSEMDKLFLTAILQDAASGHNK